VSTFWIPVQTMGNWKATQHLPRPRLHCLPHLAQTALEKMIGALEDDQLLRLRKRGDQRLHPGLRPELVAGAAHEELGLGAGFEELVVVGTLLDRSDGGAQADEGAHPGIGTGCAQADRRSK